MHTYGEKMARNGRTKDIYKGTFICIQTLSSIIQEQESIRKDRRKELLYYVKPVGPIKCEKI